MGKRSFMSEDHYQRRLFKYFWLHIDTRLTRPPSKSKQNDGFLIAASTNKNFCSRFPRHLGMKRFHYAEYSIINNVKPKPTFPLKSSVYLAFVGVPASFSINHVLTGLLKCSRYDGIINFCIIPVRNWWWILRRVYIYFLGRQLTVPHEECV